MAGQARWLLRLVLLALVVAFGVATADGLPYAVAANDPRGDTLLVAVLVTPVLALGTWLAGSVRRRATPPVARWVSFACALGQAGWAGLAASLYTLADLWAPGNVGWRNGVATFGVAVALLLVAWFAEDRLARR